MKNIFKLMFCFLVTWGAAANANSGVTTFYHNDLLGSPVAATNDRGEVAWTETYMPYGERQEKAGVSQENNLWYTGKQHDEDTGLTYINARYYDPVVGRFMAIDPLGVTEDNIHSFNRYAYANNNPYKYVDPDGRAAWFVVWPLVIVAEVAFDTISEPDVPFDSGVAQTSITLIPTPAKLASKSVALADDVAMGARGAAVEFTKEGERFVRVGARPENLKFTFEMPGGVQAGTYAFPEKTFLEIGLYPSALKNLGDLPGPPPQYFRILEPPAGAPIQRGTVPGGEFQKYYSLKDSSDEQYTSAKAKGRGIANA